MHRTPAGLGQLVILRPGLADRPDTMAAPGSGLFVFENPFSPPQLARLLPVTDTNIIPAFLPFVRRTAATPDKGSGSPKGQNRSFHSSGVPADADPIRAQGAKQQSDTIGWVFGVMGMPRAGVAKCVCKYPLCVRTQIEPTQSQTEESGKKRDPGVSPVGSSSPYPCSGDATIGKDRFQTLETEGLVGHTYTPVHTSHQQIDEWRLHLTVGCGVERTLHSESKQCRSLLEPASSSWTT